MGSPLYGRLVVNDRRVGRIKVVASESLVWSADRSHLAVQELVDAGVSGPTTRVVVVNAARRKRVTTSEARPGLSWPVAFAGTLLRYRHWNADSGERMFDLELQSL